MSTLLGGNTQEDSHVAYTMSRHSDDGEFGKKMRMASVAVAAKEKAMTVAQILAPWNKAFGKQGCPNMLGA